MTPVSCTAQFLARLAAVAVLASPQPATADVDVTRPKTASQVDFQAGGRPSQVDFRRAAGAPGGASQVDFRADRAAGGGGSQVDFREAVAIVVGSNRSPAAGTAGLQYADDDAVQGARTLELLGAKVILLVAPDEDTRALFPHTRARDRATRSAVASAIDEAFSLLGRARAAGKATRLYFFFAGHGDMAGGRAFLQLEDGRLFRDDLAVLLAGSPAHEHHLVIDACHASSFVGDRGAGGARVAAPAGFSRAAGPRWPARTGLLTARSIGDKTHEWTEFQAGIFSHEIRSGLLGAADADRDGRVTYRELGAFVHRANESIVNRKYRPEVITQPPDGEADAVFAELPDGPMLLELDTDPGRIFVDSENGVRVADLHPAPGARLTLRLPTDLGTLFLQEVATEKETRLPPTPGHLLLSALTAGTPRARSRGAAHEAFRKLFARHFDATVVQAFDPSLVDLTVFADSPPPPRRLWPWALTAAGVAANATAIGLGVWGHTLADRAEKASGLERAQRFGDIQRANRTAIAVGAAGVALVAGGIAWLWWTRALETPE